MTATFDDELLQDAQEDAHIVAFIQSFLPQEYKELFTEEQLYYFLDVINDYYFTSGVLDQDEDEDGEIDIDLEEVAAFMAKKAQEDGIGIFDLEALSYVAEAELEYTEQFTDEED